MSSWDTSARRSFGNIRTTMRMTYDRNMVEADVCDLLCLDAPKAERVRQALPPVETVELLAQRAKAYGHPTRLAIALALRDGAQLCVCDVGFIVARDEKLVSHHLRTLKNAGLASSQRDGKMVMYELTATGRTLLDAVARVPRGATQ
jgi:DNA-binding transcriptional ArsR family regulator